VREEPVVIDGKTVPGATKVYPDVGRIDLTDVMRGLIQEVENGVAILMARRDQIDAEQAKLTAEREQLEWTQKEAAKKLTRLNNALALVEEASEFAPNLPGAELKPTAGVSSVPPTSEPPAASPSDNGRRAKQSSSPKRKRVTVANQIVEAMHKAVPGEWLTKREILALMPEGALYNSLSFTLQGLVKSGTVEAKGQRSARRYRLAEQRTPAMPPAERRAGPSSLDAGSRFTNPDTPTQPPSQEGRVLSALQATQLDVLALSERVGLPVPNLRGILGKLMREGDVRLVKGDPPVYHAVP
jgi:hypothetical protein